MPRAGPGSWQVHSLMHTPSSNHKIASFLGGLLAVGDSEMAFSHRQAGWHLQPAPSNLQFSKVSVPICRNPIPIAPYLPWSWSLAGRAIAAGCSAARGSGGNYDLSVWIFTMVYLTRRTAQSSIFLPRTKVVFHSS